MENTAVVIPTFNEADNIERLVKSIRRIYPRIRIFIVDDNSPDGTAELVRKISSTDPNVRLIFRSHKQGLASAYLDAFARIIPDESVGAVITMDADFSHDPASLGKIIDSLNFYDLVIGSRYAAGGKIENWSWPRRILSKYANIYAKLITRCPISDLTAGFVGYRRELLMKILMRGLHSEGYAYQIEMKYLAYRLRAKIVELPIVFRERSSGISKFDHGTIVEGIFAPWRMIFRR